MLNLILKDLTRRWRSPVPTVVMLIFPLFMTLMIGTISSGFSDEKTPRIKVFLLDRDDSALTRFILGGFQQEEMIKRFDGVVVGEEGFALMEKGDASALVVFPKGFSDSLLVGNTTALQVVRNPAEGIFPEIIEIGAGVLGTYLHNGVKLAGDDLARIQELATRDEFPRTGQIVSLAGSIMDHITQARPVLLPPLVQITSVKEKAAAKSGDSGRNAIFGYVMVMTTVMAVLFIATRAIMDLFEERQSGMLRRQLVSPLGISQIVGGKIVFGVLFSLIVLAILALIGAVLRWYHPPIDGLAVLLLSVSFSLASCGLLALVFSLVRTLKQAGGLSWILIMGMSAVGGSMIPLDVLPAALKRVAPMTLNYWAVDGYTKLLLGHQALADVARNIGTLALLGAVTAGVAYVLMVRKVRRGFA
jgi:ABC-2 type transport system permease protein